MKEIIGEIWKPVPGFELYSASNKGRIKNKFGKELKGTYKTRGGYSISFTKEGKQHFRKKGRVIAEVFELPNPENLPYLSNKDCDPMNVELSNLYWTTAKALHHLLKKYGCAGALQTWNDEARAKRWRKA